VKTFQDIKVISLSILRPAIDLAIENAVPCKTCIICWQAESEDRSDFCSEKCAEAAVKKAPFLLEVPRGHDAFKQGEMSTFSKYPSSQNVISLRSLQFRMEKFSKTLSRSQESVHGRDETRFRTQIRGVQVWVYLPQPFSPFIILFKDETIDQAKRERKTSLARVKA